MILIASLCRAEAPLEHRQALKAIAGEIAALKEEFPQLADFQAAQAVDPERLHLDYAFRTHRATHRGGWTAGVPNPDDDGIWFYIDFHDPGSDAQIHGQPVVSTRAPAGGKEAFMLMLEGRATRKVEARIWAIVKHHAQKLDALPVE